MFNDKSSLLETINQFDHEHHGSPVIALRENVKDKQSEVPIHQHTMGQLVFALKGGVTCQLPQSTVIVPPQCAVWIPKGVLHRVNATANAQICYLFVRPDMVSLPQSGCTLSISPLVRELILDMSEQPHDYSDDLSVVRKALVLLEELGKMPIEHLSLPNPDDPRLKRIAKELFDNPADRRTLAEWGMAVAMSERSLARLFKQETGITFGRWRQQLHLIIAMHQLSEDYPVQRVADYLGYQSVTAFITMFKKSVGKPPAQYFAKLKQSES